jgi:hypothetical protein
MNSIVQDWAASLGLRHQGVLVSAIRGCDSALREDPSKYLVRAYRGVLLKPHCKDITKAASFMVPLSEDWYDAAAEFFKSIDHYPNHWLLHWMHACEIVAYKHPNFATRRAFDYVYGKLVRKFHLLPESEADLDARLNADEETFKAQQVDA